MMLRPSSPDGKPFWTSQAGQNAAPHPAELDVWVRLRQAAHQLALASYWPGCGRGEGRPACNRRAVAETPCVSQRFRMKWT